METLIIPTSTTEHLAKKIKRKAKNLKIISLGKNKNNERFFPDGEVYVRIPEINKLKRGRVVILHSGSPQPNQGLVELELILQLLKNNKIKPLVFFTYFPYGMQDEIFETGEANVAKNLVKKLTDYYSVKKIYIIDPHFGGREWIKKYPIVSILAIPLLVKKAKADFGKEIEFLSPDKGGKRRTGISGIKKKRLDSFQVRYFAPKLALKGKIVGVVDDIIETGGTLLKFYKIVKKSGAKKIIVLATQGVLNTGIAKIKKKYSKLYLTNAVKRREANVDITDLIIDALC